MSKFNSLEVLMKEFRSNLHNEIGYKLDFRRDVHIQNDYGNYPQSLNYHTAEEIVVFLYEWAHKQLQDNKERFPYLGGWEYNLTMEVEKLRIIKLKHVINCVLNDFCINYTNK